MKELNIDYKKSGGVSEAEKEVVNYIKNIYSGEIIENSKQIISPKELDIYIPEHNLAIEFNGLFWHSTAALDYTKTSLNAFKKRHLEKTKACESKNINLLHIFENEWLDPIKKEIWKSIIRYKILGVKNRYFARKLKIKILDKNNEEENYLVTKFFEENHLQGSGAIGPIRIGLFDENNELISCMTFAKSRFDKNFDYELIRFASKKDSSCVGCASKLFKYFVSNFDPKSIVSYANRRWVNKNSNLYSKLGFTFVAESEPNYFYFRFDIVDEFGLPVLFSRNKFQKHKLKDNKFTKDFYDEKLSEFDIMTAAGFYRIYDAGQLVFHWKK